LPVRSAIYKQCTGGLVVRWVTTSESPLLYVFVFAGHCSQGPWVRFCCYERTIVTGVCALQLYSHA
ncbi:hypothetical protein T440DRAFT_395152, partial [Plenodomus tracheiphilus IPT5]